MPKHARTDNADNSWGSDDLISGSAFEDDSFDEGLFEDSDSGSESLFGYGDDHDPKKAYFGDADDSYELEERPLGDDYPYDADTVTPGQKQAFEASAPVLAVADLDSDSDAFAGSPDDAIEVNAWDAASEKDETAQKKKDANLSPLQRKSRKTRRVLIVVIVLLILLIGALGYFTYVLLEEAQQQAVQQTLYQAPTDVDALKDNEPKDASTATTKRTDVPLLVTLIGKTQDEAVELVGHGATPISSLPVNEEGNPIKTEVKISLTDEPGDTRSGTPTIYLGLDGAGVIVRAGYSAATTTLGYGSSSFVDAVTKDSIIEKTLSEAGLTIAPGSVVLPKDKAEYTTYKTDGKTVEKETYSFSGIVTLNGVEYEWSAVLRYDYSAENASGNLADTIRQVYIYLYVPSAATPAELLPPDPAAADQPTPDGQPPADRPPAAS